MSAERTVQLVITPGKRGGKIPRPFADELLDRLVGEIKLPARIAVPIYSSPGRLPTDSLGLGAGTWVHPDLYALVRVTLDSTGIARRGELLEPSRDARVDSAFVGAVRHILAHDSWARQPRATNQPNVDSTVVDVELSLGAVLNKKEREIRDRRIKNTQLLILPMARLILPHYPLATGPSPVQRASMPLYPESQSFMNRSGHTMLHAVLDTNGAAVTSSVWFDESTHRDFEDAVRLWLPVARYRPARIGGCPVPVRIAQPFNFRIRG